MQAEMAKQNLTPKLLLTMEEAAQMLSLGRTFVYDLVRRKQIATVKIGRARRVPIVAIEEFIAQELQK